MLQIALTSGGIDRLDVYRRFGVSEVWFWRKGVLEIWRLRRNGSGYIGPARKSRLLPGFDLKVMIQCLGLASWREARQTFRQFLRNQRG